MPSPDSPFDLSAALGAAGYHRVPLQRLSTGHLELQVVLNGVSGRFILDTGAGGTVVERQHQVRFGLEAIRSEHTGSGAGGSDLALKNSEGNTIAFGALSIPNFKIVLMDLSHVNNAFVALNIPEVDGVIGADVLSSRASVIDYGGMGLWLSSQVIDV